MANIIIAKSAGFCFGVDNAVKLAFEALEHSPNSTCTFGELIHNRQVSERLKKGCQSSFEHG